MSEKRVVRKFDVDFKKQVASMVLVEGLTRSEVARRFDLAPAVVGQWVKKFQDDGVHAFPGKGKINPEQQELNQLKRDLRRVTMERDILKKTISLFAEPLK